MTQKECLDKTGEAFGVLENDGTINWYPTFISGELARYKNLQTPEALAQLRAKKVDALKKARAVTAGKRAERERLKTELCPKGCGHTLSLCVCDLIPEVVA